MRELVRFTVFGQPVAKGRPRASIRGGHVHMRTPKKTAQYEAFVAATARMEYGDPPYEGPVSLIVLAVFQRPKRLCRKKDPNVRMWCGVKPDADNICKAIGDGLEKGGIIRNDSQIVHIEIRKVYAAKENDGPQAVVVLRTVDDLPTL